MRGTPTWHDRFKLKPTRRDKLLFTLERELPALDEKRLTSLQKLPSPYERVGVLAATGF